MDDSPIASETIEAPQGFDAYVERERAVHARRDAIVARLGQLRAPFTQNIAAATADWTHLVHDEAGLAGMAEYDKRRARRSAAALAQDGFLLTLDARSYEAAIDAVGDRKLRRDLYEAYVTRASDQGPRRRRFDNGPLVQEILALRHELAELHGCASYAEFALQDSVLTTSHEVERYLLTGGEQIRARAQQELDDIWAFAKEKGAPKGFATWDLGFYAKWMLREQLGFCEDDLRAYFAFPDVLLGAFALGERLLEVGMVQLAGSPSGREPMLYKLVTERGEELGLIEIEPLRAADAPPGPRLTLQVEPPEGDCSGGPVLRLCLDLERVDDDAPLLLTHAEVTSLFRDVGRGLFLLRARAPRHPAPQRSHAIAGTVAGCFFERLCGHFELLATFARHHATGAPLPRALFDKLLSSQRAREGLTEAQTLEQALFDLRVHRDFVPPDKATQLRQHVFDTLAQVRREVCVLRPPFWDKSVNVNVALFVEDGAMRAWESVWAARAARDLFAAFQSSLFDPPTARRLRETFWSSSERSVLERLTDALGTAPAPHP